MTTNGSPDAVVAAGRLLPSGGRLVLAALAGLLWLTAGFVLAHVPSGVRAAHLWAVRTGEGQGWALVGIQLLAAGVLLAVGHGLSVAGHGDRRHAPALVVVVRAATWMLALALLAGALGVAAFPGEACFRTCRPFPH